MENVTIDSNHGKEKIIINTPGGGSNDANDARSSLSKLLRWLLTGIGVSVFLYLIYRMGWQNILDNILHFGAWFIVILMIQMVWVVLQATSWYMIQNSLFQRAHLLFFIRNKIISDTMNTVLPMANLGGDAMRAYLIKPRIPLKEGVAGIVVDKTIESIAGSLFLACGVLITILFFPISQAIMIPAVACFLALVIVITLLILFQLRGFYRSAMDLFNWIPAVSRLLEKKKEILGILDENMRLLYQRGRVNIPLSIWLHFMARIIGVFEVLIVLWVLHHPMGFFGSWFISAAVTIANTILFIVPGHWGVQEGMYALVFKTMYFSASVGLSLAIIRRIRRIFLLGLGLMLFNLKKEKQVDA